MEKLNATDAKREFGDLLIKAQTEPVSINKNGKPVAVVISDKEFHELENYKVQFIKIAIAEGLKDIENSNTVSHIKVFNDIETKLKLIKA